MFSKFAITSTTRAAFKQIACYSTEAPSSKVDVSSFLGRIDALHAAQAQKKQDKKSGFKFDVKRTSNSGPGKQYPRNGQSKQSDNNRPPRQFNNNNGNQQPRKQFTPRTPGSGPRNTQQSNFAPRNSGPAKPSKNLGRYNNMDIDSALTDSSHEKVDLHVSTEGGVLFDRGNRSFSRNNNNNNNQRNFGQRGGQRSGPRSGPNNNNRGPSARFGAKSGSPRFQRKGPARKRPSKRSDRKDEVIPTIMSPEQAHIAVRREIAKIGTGITVNVVSRPTMSPFMPHLGHSARCRIIRAIHNVPKTADGKFDKESVKAIVESTYKGTISGFYIPPSTQAKGQEGAISALNNNRSLSFASKDLLLKLASGETPISSLKK